MRRMLDSRPVPLQVTTKGKIRTKMRRRLVRTTLQMVRLTMKSKSSKLLIALLGAVAQERKKKRLNRLLRRRPRIQRRKYLTK